MSDWDFCRACGRELDRSREGVWEHIQGGLACSSACRVTYAATPWRRRMPQLVAFTGRAGSGKTTAAKALQERGYTIHSFAAPIKAAMAALGVPPEALTPEGKGQPLDLLCGRTPRDAMQTLGTEWGRQMVGDDLWVRSWKATLPEGPVVIDDLRFLNEAAFLRSQGATIIKVHRPDLAAPADLHISEQEMRQIEADDTVFNVGDIRTYQIVVRELVETYAGR